jgi:hypothetical protein
MTLTPEQKAELLVESFARIMPNENWKEKAKQCALLCVDDMLFQITEMRYGLAYLNQVAYWEEVKQEIEKL